MLKKYVYKEKPRCLNRVGNENCWGFGKGQEAELLESGRGAKICQRLGVAKCWGRQVRTCSAGGLEADGGERRTGEAWAVNLEISWACTGLRAEVMREWPGHGTTAGGVFDPAKMDPSKSTGSNS